MQKSEKHEHKSDHEHEHADINGPTRLTQCENHGNGSRQWGASKRENPPNPPAIEAPILAKQASKVPIIRPTPAPPPR